ncbi:ATP-grasp domain-containing protein [Quadrisphaera oryzae]|uniref:ATP-grasp domain-containing protein n=1 Tax=Quadrisphaera TaxID=317661 RepID=UPI001646C4BC|nr:ATP-grasp domain-containing protein [Quadrisphaera sp. RL12-1S]
MLLLVPCDPVDPRRPDEHLAAEARAAREAGAAVALVDHDALARGDAAEGVRRVRRAAVEDDDAADAVYRGWMLRTEHYDALEGALAERGVQLRTSADQYRTAHELPGWVDALAPVTPRSRWTTGADLDAVIAAGAALGPVPAVLRDWTKSLKHSWDEAAFVPDAADAAAVRRVASRFLELRGDDLTGGLVLRRFERFTGPETRTWWTTGPSGTRCALLTPHPDGDGDGDGDGDVTVQPDLSLVEPLVSALALPFVTVDVVQRDDGAWRVVELGDGQVSDRPRSTDPAALVAALLAAAP